MEISNNNQIIDFRKSGGNTTIDFSGKTLEIKYFLRTSNELATFLGQLAQHIAEINQIRNSLKFSKIWCRFDFGKQQISEQVQKKLIDVQDGSFDEITVQLVGDDLSVFERVLDYAISKEKPVSVLADLVLHINTLEALIGIISNKRPTSTRWKYHKIDTFIRKYRYVSASMQELLVPYYLTACNKRCSIKNFEEVAAAIVARGFFGFKGCCLDYKAPKKKGQRVFVKSVDSFNENTYLWDKLSNNQDYRQTRMESFNKLNSANVSNSEIKKRKKVKGLFDKLKKL